MSASRISASRSVFDRGRSGVFGVIAKLWDCYLYYRRAPPAHICHGSRKFRGFVEQGSRAVAFTFVAGGPPADDVGHP